MTAPTLVIGPQHGRRRRRRWPWVLLTLIVIAGLLVGAAEVLARIIAPGIVRDQVATALNLPADQEIEVSLPGFLVGQLIAGRVDEVGLRADDVDLGGLRGDIDATITGVALDGRSIDGIAGTMRIGSEHLLAILASADLPLDEARLDAGMVTLAGTVRVLGVGVPIEISVEAEVADGTVLLHPFAFELASVRVDREGLIDRLGPVGVALTGPFPVCLADRMPRGVELVDLRIQGDAAEIDFRVDGAIMTDTSLRRPGTC